MVGPQSCGGKPATSPRSSVMSGSARMAASTACAKPSRSTASAPRPAPDGSRRRAGRAIRAAHFAMQDADRIGLGVVGAEGVGADELGEGRGAMRFGSAYGAHLVEHDRNAGSGERQAASDPRGRRRRHGQVSSPGIKQRAAPSSRHRLRRGRAGRPFVGRDLTPPGDRPAASLSARVRGRGLRSRTRRAASCVALRGDRRPWRNSAGGAGRVFQASLLLRCVRANAPKASPFRCAKRDNARRAGRGGRVRTPPGRERAPGVRPPCARRRRR